MNKGAFTLDNGTKIEAGTFTGSTAFKTVSLQQTYDIAPIILSQVITENEIDAVTGRVRNISQSSFACAMQEQETTRTSHFAETINYIAWKPGKGEAFDLIYVRRDTSRVTFS